VIARRRSRAGAKLHVASAPTVNPVNRGDGRRAVAARGSRRGSSAQAPASPSAEKPRAPPALPRRQAHRLQAAVEQRRAPALARGGAASSPAVPPAPPAAAAAAAGVAELDRRPAPAARGNGGSSTNRVGAGVAVTPLPARHQVDTELPRRATRYVRRVAAEWFGAGGSPYQTSPTPCRAALVTLHASACAGGGGASPPAATCHRSARSDRSTSTAPAAGGSGRCARAHAEDRGASGPPARVAAARGGRQRRVLSTLEQVAGQAWLTSARAGKPGGDRLIALAGQSRAEADSRAAVGKAARWRPRGSRRRAHRRGWVSAASISPAADLRRAEGRAGNSAAHQPHRSGRLTGSVSRLEARRRRAARPARTMPRTRAGPAARGQRLRAATGPPSSTPPAFTCDAAELDDARHRGARELRGRQRRQVGCLPFGRRAR